MVTITRFMKMCWDSEQKTGKHQSDNQPLKRGNNNGDKNQDDPKANKKNEGNKNDKANKKAKDDGLCRRRGCKDAPRHKWANCYYNRNSSNYRPDLDQAGGGRGGCGGRGGRGN